MLRNNKRFNQQKHLFKGIHYCLECKQKKSCGKLDNKKTYCCTCYSQVILEELEKDGLLISSAQQALNNYRLGVIACQCLGGEKTRIEFISSDGSGWIRCEREECKRIVAGAGHHGVIKNRNNPGFWGLNIPEKVLCGKCLGKRKKEMTPLRRAKFNEYKKLGRL